MYAEGKSKFSNHAVKEGQEMKLVEEIITLTLKMTLEK